MMAAERWRDGAAQPSVLRLVGASPLEVTESSCVLPPQHVSIRLQFGQPAFRFFAPMEECQRVLAARTDGRSIRLRVPLDAVIASALSLGPKPNK